MIISILCFITGLFWCISSIFFGIVRVPGAKAGEFFSNMLIKLPKSIAFVLFFNWKYVNIPLNLIIFSLSNYILLGVSAFMRYAMGITEYDNYILIAKWYLGIFIAFILVTFLDQFIYHLRGMIFRR